MEEDKRPRLNNGLFMSTSPLDQPAGTLRYARNAQLNETLGAWSNEHGIKWETSLPTDSIVVGCVPLTDDRIVLFLKVNTRSQIGVWAAGSYQTLYDPFPTLSTDLGFDPTYPIIGTFSQQADGDVMVYWTDDLNPPRALNITRQALSNPTLLYGLSPQTSPDTLQSGRLNLFPHAGPVPHAELKGVFSGGGCKTGSYHLALGYRDGDLIRTNTLMVGNAVPIVDEHEGISPIESYDGAPSDTLSGKSIVWDISNINTDMKYLTVSIIARIGEILSAFELKDVEINGTTAQVSFTGPQTASLSSPDSVLTDNVEYVRVKTMEQLDNSLYLGNLTTMDDIGYQPYANFIKSEPVLHTFPRFDPFSLSDDFLMRRLPPAGQSPSDVDQGYRSPKNVHDLKGYQRDEVYAFYIAFILKSGRMSMAYHIPGRDGIENVPLGNLERLIPESDNASLAGTIPTVNEDATLYGQNINNWYIIPLTGGTSNPQGYMFQWFDFSHLTNLGSRGMNFWKNLNEFYPDSDNWRVLDAQSSSPVGDLRNQNVRHHRFPGNRNRDFTTVKSSNAYSMNLIKSDRLVINWAWMGGFERNLFGDFGTITGIFQGDLDFEDARTYQDTIGEPMGGEGDNHDSCKIVCATVAGPYSCFPNLNSTLPSVLERPDLNLCNSNTTNIEYRYNTAGPPSSQQTLIVGYDSPALWQPDFPPTQDGSWIMVPEPGPGHCSGIAIVDVHLISGQGSNLNISVNNFRGQSPGTSWVDMRGGWVAWASCESVIDNKAENIIEQEVRALGIKFSDIKVPQSIADKAQGFRIYYAKRTHENRTIFGQAPIHPMADRYRVNVAGCHQFTGSNRTLDYWLPGGVPAPTDPSWVQTTFSFHDFYLLRETPSLAQATHIRLQYSMGMFSFAGPTKYYVDGVESDTGATPPIYSCFRPGVITSFHISGDHEQPEDIYETYPLLLNFTLRDKARAYVLGNTIYEASGSGFDLPIYNIGGHTHIALRTSGQPNYLVSGVKAEWRQLRSDNAGLLLEPSQGYTNIKNLPPTQVAKEYGLMLHLANLNAFKTDVYSPLDSQELVWTGYEIVGERFKDFIVPEDLRSPNLTGTAPAFTTDDIFGGDTYICRYGYRMTHREEVASVANSFPDTAGIDHKSVIMTIVESTENINFRHIDNDKVPYFPGDTLKNMLKVKADTDLTYHPDSTTGNIRYNKDYSAVNDLKVILPLPFYLEQNDRYPYRVIRSDRSSAANLEDMYRYFRALEFRDLSSRYGQLWKLSAMNNRLLFHMEDSLFISKGKQRMKVSEGEDAQIGSGDIFEQEPDIILHTDSGFLGTRSKFSCLVTPEGYFFVDIKNRKIFLASNSPEDLSSDKYGMDDWFRQNLPFALEEYGYSMMDDSFITGAGFHAVWDQRFERIILTKRDLVPLPSFIQLYKGIFNRFSDASQIQTGIITVNGKFYYRLPPQAVWTELVVDQSTLSPLLSNSQGILPLFERKSWTVSFKTAKSKDSMGVWESFHDYVPYMYSYTGTDVVSFIDNDSSLYKHNDTTNPGLFYNTLYPFEIEAVIRTDANMDLLFHAFSFLTETYGTDPLTDSLRTDLHAGFTSFSAYTSDHFTGDTPLEYLINTRRLGSEWRVNQLRDLSKQTTSTSAYYTGPFTQGNHGYQGMAATGQYNQGTVKGTGDAFYTVNGMFSTPNPNALDLSKPWYLQSKLTGRYMGVRLVADNMDRKLINLHTVLADFRPYKR